MNMKSILLIASVGAMGFLTGCQTVPYQGQARDVTLKPQKEGVLSLPIQYRPEDRNVAMTKMNEHCAPYMPVIMEEGEAVVGQKTTSDARETKRDKSEHQVGSLFGIPLVSGDKGGKDTSTSSVTTQVKEWHISYKCDHKSKQSKAM